MKVKEAVVGKDTLVKLVQGLDVGDLLFVGYLYGKIPDDLYRVTFHPSSWFDDSTDPTLKELSKFEIH